MVGWVQGRVSPEGGGGASATARPPLWPGPPARLACADVHVGAGAAAARRRWPCRHAAIGVSLPSAPVSSLTVVRSIVPEQALLCTPRAGLPCALRWQLGTATCNTIPTSRATPQMAMVLLAYSPKVGTLTTATACASMWAVEPHAKHPTEESIRWRRPASKECTGPRVSTGRMPPPGRGAHKLSEMSTSNAEGRMRTKATTARQ